MSEIDTRIEQLLHLANRAVRLAHEQPEPTDREWWLQRATECEEEASRLCRTKRTPEPPRDQP